MAHELPQLRQCWPSTLFKLLSNRNCDCNCSTVPNLGSRALLMASIYWHQKYSLSNSKFKSKKLELHPGGHLDRCFHLPCDIVRSRTPKTFCSIPYPQRYKNPCLYKVHTVLNVLRRPMANQIWVNDRSMLSKVIALLSMCIALLHCALHMLFEPSAMILRDQNLTHSAAADHVLQKAHFQGL